MAVNFEELLVKLLHSRIRTSFIYPIAQIEEEFGDLWGHNKDYEDLTKEELIWFEKYQIFRKKVLDNGNNQLRQVYYDLAKCGVRCNPNYVEFDVKKENE